MFYKLGEPDRHNRAPTWGFHVQVIGRYSWLKEHNKPRRYKVTAGHGRVVHTVYESRLVYILDFVLDIVKPVQLVQLG